MMQATMKGHGNILEGNVKQRRAGPPTMILPRPTADGMDPSGGYRRPAAEPEPGGFFAVNVNTEAVA